MAESPQDLCKTVGSGGLHCNCGAVAMEMGRVPEVRWADTLM